MINTSHKLILAFFHLIYLCIHQRRLCARDLPLRSAPAQISTETSLLRDNNSTTIYILCK
jgi:hypothetical protein